MELSCEKMFCVGREEDCFSWVNKDMNNGCENSHLKLEDIHIAVKTYAGNYRARLPLVTNTWLNDARNITKFYTHSLEGTNQFNGELIFVEVGFEYVLQEEVLYEVNRVFCARCIFRRIW